MPLKKVSLPNLAHESGGVGPDSRQIIPFPRVHISADSGARYAVTKNSLAQFVAHDTEILCMPPALVITSKFLSAATNAAFHGLGCKGWGCHLAGLQFDLL
jgi:hypothetical protein